MVRPVRLAVPALLILVVGASLSPARPRAAVSLPRIVAVGDIHGDFDAFVGILRRTGLVDDAMKWSGDDAVLVQTGDYTDRGTKVRQVLDLMMALEGQAQAAGGRVEVLLGNHEGMNLISEVRDVNPATYGSFAGPESEARREAAWEAYETLARKRASEMGAWGDRQLQVPGVYTPPAKEAWLAARPPGFIEYLEALSPHGDYGKWLRKRPATVRIGETVFVHGGFNPEFSSDSLEEINKEVRKEIERFDKARDELVARKAALPFFRFQELLQAGRSVLDQARAQAAAGDAVTRPAGLSLLENLERIGTWNLVNPNGPLWFRGFATWSQQEGVPRVDTLTSRYKTTRFVVGHTMTAGFRITPRFSERVFLIDTGMLSSHYKGGRASALELRDGRLVAIYEDGDVVLQGIGAAASTPR